MRADLQLSIILSTMVACTGESGDTDTDTDTELDSADQEAIYVSPDGADAGAGTTADPVSDLSLAVSMAEETGRVVRMAGGHYVLDEEVASTVSIEGGYDPATWEHDPESFTTTLTSVGPVALRVTTFEADSDEVSVSHLSIRAGYGVGSALMLGSFEVPFAARDVVVEGEEGTLNVVRGPGVLERVVVAQTLLISAGAGEVEITDSTIEGRWLQSGGEVVVRDTEIGDLQVYRQTTSDTCALTATRIRADALGVWSDQEGQRCTVQIRESELSDDVLNVGDGGDLLLAGNTVTIDRNPVSGYVGGIFVHQDAYLELVANTVHLRRPGAPLTGLRIRGELVAAHNVFMFGDAASVTAISDDSGASKVVAVNNAFVFADTAGEEVLLGSAIDAEFDVTLHHNAITGASCLVDSECLDLAGLHACGWDGCTSASGNLEVTDPGFADADNGDFHITTASPLHDAGTDPLSAGIAFDELSPDLDGDTRPQGAGWDIGIDEVAE